MSAGELRQVVHQPQVAGVQVAFVHGQRSCLRDRLGIVGMERHRFAIEIAVQIVHRGPTREVSYWLSPPRRSQRNSVVPRPRRSGTRSDQRLLISAEPRERRFANFQLSIFRLTIPFHGDGRPLFTRYARTVNRAVMHQPIPRPSRPLWFAVAASTQDEVHLVRQLARGHDHDDLRQAVLSASSAATALHSGRMFNLGSGQSTA